MNVLVTGINGQLGHDVALVLADRGINVLAPTHSEMDITDKNAICSYFQKYKPEALIHCAAYTAVDKAEDEPDLCRKVNVDGTRYLVECCAEGDIPMMYISTDYVFDGTGERPWEPEDPTQPINTYGLSKRDGELEVLKLDKYFVIRISWVFGINGNNFVKTMLRLSDSKDSLNIVDDQYGSPTYTKDLAELISDMIVTKRYGIYHAHNEGVCSWADFAEEIFRVSGKEVKVVRITSDQYPMKAKRPANSRMSTVKLKSNGFFLLPDWKNAVRRYLNELIMF